MKIDYDTILFAHIFYGFECCIVKNFFGNKLLCIKLKYSDGVVNYYNFRDNNGYSINRIKKIFIKVRSIVTKSAKSW